MMFLSLTLEIIAFVIVIVLFFLSITIHYVPNNFIWIFKKKGKPYRILKPGIHFVFPFINKLVKKALIDEQKCEIYLTNVVTKDGSNECFKIDYSYIIKDINLYNYEFDLSDYIIISLRNYVVSVDIETLIYDLNLISNKIYAHIKEVIEANGYSITKITIYYEK